MELKDFKIKDIEEAMLIFKKGPLNPLQYNLLTHIMVLKKAYVVVDRIAAMKRFEELVKETGF